MPVRGGAWHGRRAIAVGGLIMEIQRVMGKRYFEVYVRFTVEAENYEQAVRMAETNLTFTDGISVFNVEEVTK